MIATEQSEHQFRTLLGKLPAGAYTCDTGGLITFYNRSAADIRGREPQLNNPADRYCGSYCLYSTSGTRVPHDQCWMALALRENREYNAQEIVIERPDGSYATALAHANPLAPLLRGREESPRAALGAPSGSDRHDRLLKLLATLPQLQ